MARTDPQVNLRIPAELKVEIQEAAIENGRSLNAEIVARLQDSLLSEPTDLKSSEILGAIMERIDRLSNQLESERSERLQQQDPSAKGR